MKMTLKNGYALQATELVPGYGNAIAQIFYELLKNNTSITNEKYVGADVFTDSNGVKNTIDTTSTTAYYDSGNYLYQISSGNTSDTLETDTIITTDSSPNSILIYAETSIVSGTSITVDVSLDGGTTWSVTGKNLNEYIDLSDVTGTTLALKFHLTSDSTSYTPKIYGYSVVITDE